MGNSESTNIAKLENRPTVVVIGGGFGGIQIAKELDSQFNVVLIDRKNYFFNNIGALRASCDPSWAPKIIVPYTKLMKYGHFVQAEVEEISPQGVKVFGLDKSISFDYLVIATGTSYAFPFKVAIPNSKDVAPVYQETQDAIQKAKRITIIGGGPVGVELLGEIHDYYPEKQITLIHSQNKIVSDPGVGGERFRDKLMGVVSRISNTKIILGERAILEGDETQSLATKRFVTGERTITTDKGTKIETDLVFFCGGSKVNNNSFKKHFSDQLDEKGQLKVNQFLQVEGYDKIFAIGDCSNIAGAKMGYLAAFQATHVSKNIQLHDQKQPMKEYVKKFPGGFITVGKSKGVGQFPAEGETVVGNFLVSNLKGKSLFVSLPWENTNKKLPSGLSEIITAIPQIDDISRLSRTVKLSEEDTKLLTQSVSHDTSPIIGYT